MAVTAESVVVELIARNEAFDRQIKQSATGFVDAAGRIERSSVQIERSNARIANAQRNLGFQFQDFTTQVAAGGSVFTAFAQQAGQAAGSVAELGGAVGRIGAFFAGPWGSIIIAATAVLGNLALAHSAARDAADEQEKSEVKLTRALTARERVLQRTNNPELAKRLRDEALVDRLPAGSVIQAVERAARLGTPGAGFVREDPVIEVQGRRTAPSAASSSRPARVTQTVRRAPEPFVRAEPGEADLALDRRVANLGFGFEGNVAAENARQLAVELGKVDFQIDAINAKDLKLSALETGVQFAEDISRNLGQAIVNGQSLGDALVNSFKAAGAQLITSGLLNILSGGASGVSFGKSLASIGSLFGLAGGGPVSAGQVVRINETGQELFAPNVPGRIIPAGQASMGGGQGGVINQTISINFAGNAATREEAATFARIAYEQSLKAMRESGFIGVPMA